MLAELYRLTPMEETFGINNVALVDGQPRTLGLRELLTIYVDHRLDVTRRRSEFRRRKRQERLHLVDGILIALLNIDEVIQVIRTSDDSAEAKSRLQQIFDLSEIQAQYILDTPLRRLTRYDRLELEREQETLRARDRRADRDPRERRTAPRAWSAARWPTLAKKFGTPRRTVLMEAGAAVRAAVPLEVADDPCLVVLSATGLLARFPLPSPMIQNGLVMTPRPPPHRAAHDIVASAVSATARGTIGAVTSAGRMIRLSVLEIPSLPPTRSWRPSLAGGHPVDGVRARPGARARTCWRWRHLTGRGCGRCTRHRQSGIVKRVQPEYPANRDEFELITLKDDDRVVGAAHLRATTPSSCSSPPTRSCCASRPPRCARRAARPAGMAGIRLDAGASVVWFGALGPSAASGDPTADAAVVVTVAGRSGALPGTGAASVKVTPFAEYPPKGRATGGVRCQRFLKGEDGLIAAWIGPAPVARRHRVGCSCGPGRPSGPPRRLRHPPSPAS